MKLLSLLFFLTIIFSINDINGQNFYDIKLPKKKTSRKCKKCLELIKNKPKEIQFDIKRDDFDNLYFVVSRKEWFKKLIKNRRDGIAIDIVSRSRYDCSKAKIDTKSYFKGELQRPMYLKELKKNTLPSESEKITIRMGKVPPHLRDKDIEFNIIILKNKELCYYKVAHNIKSYRWNLLDMGLYFDSLTYQTNLDTILSDKDKYILQHKTLSFEIPFEKDKSDYSSADIRPLYDSLNLTDYNIKKITIKAYSSIEGNTKRNKALQQKRAKCIIDALQAYQKASIKTKVFTSENWADLSHDISTSPYSYLTELSKAEVKKKLDDDKLRTVLEPYLKKHRKAIVILELEKKVQHKDYPTPKLISSFSEAITEQDLALAIDIQNSIFKKVKNCESPVQLLDKLEIPEKSEYSILFNKNAVFKFLMNKSEIYKAYNELNALKDIMPKNGHINYNLCALKFKVWLLGEETITPTDFKKEIHDLAKMGIPYGLVKRMLINYEIIMSEHYMKQGDFKKKDKSLRYIHSNYRSFPLTNADYLSLAQFFTSYAKYKWAINMLRDKVKGVDANEDLLFYYLNLTLSNDRMIRDSRYQTMLRNACRINPNRFCSLFNTPRKGGITFQLLENKFLREIYCEKCEQH